MDEADGGGTPAELSRHGKNGDAHVHAVHVAEQESREAEEDNQPSFWEGATVDVGITLVLTMDLQLEVSFDILLLFLVLLIF